MHRNNVRPSLIEQRVLRWLFVLYCLFILYGTFIPFRFSSDPVFIAAQWRSFFPSLYVNGVRQFSNLDVVSNVLLFIPFGFFWVGSEFGQKSTAGFFKASFGIGLIGGLFSLGIEFGQLYSRHISQVYDSPFCRNAPDHQVFKILHFIDTAIGQNAVFKGLHHRLRITANGSGCYL